VKLGHSRAGAAAARGAALLLHTHQSGTSYRACHVRSMLQYHCSWEHMGCCCLVSKCCAGFDSDPCTAAEQSSTHPLLLIFTSRAL
jgi:hypothetical protein